MSNDPKPKPLTSGTGPIVHIGLTDPAEIERIKAEFVAKMKASAKTWPGRKRAKRRK